MLADYLDYFAERGDPRQIDATVLRTGSLDGRELFAAMASGGRLRWAQIRDQIIGARYPERLPACLEMVASLDPRPALRLARIVALQSLFPDDRPIALDFFKLFVQVHGIKALQAQHIRLYCDLAFQMRDWQLVRRNLAELRMPELDRLMLQTDLLNPHISSPFGDAKTWLEQLNQSYVGMGVAPLELEQGLATLPAFDRLSARPTTAVTDGARVTVVVTSWSPDQGLITAIRSIISQTWKNLEVLVIDDCSPDEYLPLLEQAAAMDPRVKVIRQPRNGGTYVARNRGILEATGKYFTVQDSDDWAHPERIERQVRALESDAALVSTSSMAYRCDENLVFNLLGTSAIRDNASSLLFDLARVRDRIGFYEASRKGADTEYTLRMLHAFGPESHRNLAEPLAMIRLSPGSLSREEFKPGWRHPSRTMFRRSYEAWHQAAKDQPGGLYRPFVQETQVFRKPARFLVEQQGEEAMRRQAYDLVLAADLRATARPDRSIVEEAQAAARAGLRVALLHMESYRNSTRREVEPLDPDVERLLSQGCVDEVLYTDPAAVGLLVLRDPTLLQFPPGRPSGLKVARALVVAGHGARGPDGRIHYEPHDVASGCFRCFSADPRWVATNAAARRLLESELCARLVAARTWPRVVVTDLWHTPRSPVSGRAPILGRFIAKRAGGGLPAGRQARARALGADTELQVRFLDDHSMPRAGRLLGRKLPANWRVLTNNTVSPDLFLASCDFFSHHHTGKPTQDEAWDIRRAMASGCITLLPPDWGGHFGDAAVYCDPDAVPDVVRRIHDDPGLQAAQRRRSQEWLRAQEMEAGFAKALSGFASTY
ncbi:hypothetical protein GCM10011521_01100 [Arenimonas soli]|uniref:Glycosyltransferase 2-like domain-containing protein n=1 Tax=Arenimonas soli TaxID=2269504 RepID=A0ABQ1H9E1_9GAMM|nr:hypothetical protein GCM10011521_01100 [Arenimonas soli]